MSEPYSTPQEAIKSFKSDLPSLQATLAPLFPSSSTWAENREKLSTLERAKMDILLAYTINDLVWVYLKLRGVDPEDHQVTKELERIKKYYAKIRQVEQPEQQRSSKVDQQAAKRFVTASIPRSQRRNGDEDMPSTSAAALARRQAEEVDVDGRERAGKSSRFRFIADGGEKVGVGAGSGVEDEGGLSVVDGNVLELEEEEEEEEEEEGDEAEAGEGEEEGEDGGDVVDQADELLKGIQGEIAAQARGTIQQEGPTKETRNTTNTHVKRKRAEDLA